MNCLLAEQLPLFRPVQIYWYRSIEPRFLYDPPYASDKQSRFNSGQQTSPRVVYFASNQLLARFEARDILGSWFGDSVPSPRASHVVAEYRINFGQTPSIVHAAPHQLEIIESSVQEMTGDWSTYPWDGKIAPTQQLAIAVFERKDQPIGLIAPSAHNPYHDNLILFRERLSVDAMTFERVAYGIADQ